MSQFETQFKADLAQAEPLSIVEKWIMAVGTRGLLPAQEAALRGEVAQRLQVNEVGLVVTGSAKLGFSLNPDHLYRDFSSSSDIDLAIVDSALFDKIWHEVFEFERGGGDWDKQDLGSFRRYLFKGWLRPDFLPRSHSITTMRTIWREVETVNRSPIYERHKINVGVFKSPHFLKAYHIKNIASLKE